MKWSILVCTLPDRTKKFLSPLVLDIEKQINKVSPDDIQLLYLGDNKSMKVGMKRNLLLELASIQKSEYVSFVDDDDQISGDYVKEIYAAINKYGTDTICFNAYYSHDGQKPKLVYYSKEFLNDKNYKEKFERLPNQLMCIKLARAKQVGFLNRSIGEDSAFARGLANFGQTEHIIKKFLYTYMFRSDVSETFKLLKDRKKLQE